MLEKINYYKKKKEMIKNIKDFNNCNIGSDIRHRKRLYTFGFLHYCGYTALEIKNIIIYYNPKLENSISHKKFISEYYIQNEVLDYSNKKSIIEKKPSLNIKSKDEDDNKLYFQADNFKDRYNLIPFFDKNKKFFENANIIAYGYKLEGIEKYNIYGQMYKYNPKEVPYYRSIGGIDHVLFVCDLDRSNFNNSLDKTKEYAKELLNKMDFDIIKFSGSEGYHLIKYMPENTTVKNLRDLAFCLDPFENKLDWHLFNDLNWKIRGYCINLKTGFMSEDVELY